jgi:hypothetical protein
MGDTPEAPPNELVLHAASAEVCGPRKKSSVPTCLPVAFMWSCGLFEGKGVSTSRFSLFLLLSRFSLFCRTAVEVTIAPVAHGGGTSVAERIVHMAG